MSVQPLLRCSELLPSRAHLPNAASRLPFPPPPDSAFSCSFCLTRCSCTRHCDAPLPARTPFAVNEPLPLPQTAFLAFPTSASPPQPPQHARREHGGDAAAAAAAERWSAGGQAEAGEGELLAFFIICRGREMRRGHQGRRRQRGGKAQEVLTTPSTRSDKPQPLRPFPPPRPLLLDHFPPRPSPPA